MRLNRLHGFVLAGLLASMPVLAKDKPINIKTDIKGQYFLVEKALGESNLPTLLVKRVTPAGRSVYVKREFDCNAKTARYLGSGESMSELAEDKADEKAHPIQKDSINEQLASLACSS